jgi:heme-degrading monooxygenase HmoA
MTAVIFEVWLAPGERQTYLDIPACLHPLLGETDGFISVEHFESPSEPGKLLSFSIWRGEKAVASWRNLEAHCAAQDEWRARIFRDYRLRIAGVVRDYGMTERAQAPADSRAAND